MNGPIRTSGLVKRYGDQTAVDSVDLGGRSGEVFGFLGPHGAGKTTTLRMLVGLVKPTGVTDVVSGTHATVTLLCYAALSAAGSILLVRAPDLP